MAEWWTYRPSDFLLFSARTYYRLFELYNAEVWPAHVLTVGLGLVLWAALWQGRAWAPRAACVLLAALWLWVAWAFYWQRYASINWAATWFAAAFAVEGLLLACATCFASRCIDAPRSRERSTGLALLLLALAIHPTLGALLGRPWQQSEVFGLAPDPTVLGTLGVLLMQGQPSTAWWLLWPIPLLWCAITGTTLATMHAADALLMPAAAMLAVLAAASAARAGTLR
jgi:hypothetical protein